MTETTLEAVRPQIWLQHLAKVKIPRAARCIISFFVWDVEEIVMTEDYLVAMTDYSVWTISQAINWLIKNGYLVRTHRGWKNRYKSSPARYMRTLPSSVDVSQHLESSSLDGIQELGMLDGCSTGARSSSLGGSQPKRITTNKRSSSLEKNYSASEPDGSSARKPITIDQPGGLAKYKVPAGVDVPRESPVPVKPVPKPKNTKAQRDAQWAEDIVARERGSK